MCAKDLYIKRLVGDGFPAGQEEFDLTVERTVTRSHAKKNRSHPEAPEMYRYVGPEYKI